MNGESRVTDEQERQIVMFLDGELGDAESIERTLRYAIEKFPEDMRKDYLLR